MKSSAFVHMFRVKALVLKLVQTNARNKGHCQSDLLENVTFVAQFEVTNSRSCAPCRTGFKRTTLSRGEHCC